MPRRHFARVSIILLIAAALAVPPAWGAPRWLSGEVSLLDIFARLWGSLTAAWSESGCNVDPHGGCATAQEEPPSPSPTTDHGCKIDPNGGCTPGS